jgi:putative polyketide hydroxylase
MMTRTSSADCQVLIVGAGPAGLVIAITAIRNGAQALVVERHPGTSIYPRATGVHLRTVELLRSWGLHRQVRALDVRVRPLRSVSPTMREATGLPIGYPTDPREVLAVSPVLPVWCPQVRLEPVLLEHLRSLGGEIRFGVELIDLLDDGAGFTAILRDRATGAQSSVCTRFVVGADGTRSVVRQALGIRMRRLGEAGEFVNTIFTANLDSVLGERRFGPYVITHPDAAGIIIRVSDNRWFYARQWFPERGQSPAEFTPQRCTELIRTAVGDPTVDVRLLTWMPFTMIAEIAASFRAGNGFLVGDAAHRMTPAGALGMNTAIQSAHNLGWKLAWAARGWAGEALLDSYHAERHPRVRATRAGRCN